MIVIAETEIWPNLITTAAQREIPVVLVNGRMSDKAFGRYRLIRNSIRDLLSSYDKFFFKTQKDRESFAYFGVQDDRAIVAGDMKFDAPLALRSEGRIREIRSRAGVGEDEFLLVAGSTRSGEEEQLIRIYHLLKGNYSKLRLMLAPRHVERATEIGALLRAVDCPYIVYGDSQESQGVILVDRMGFLNDLYMAADVAFVGGTLVDVGGHNLLEPVWAGTPVLFGPYLSNVQDAADYILKHDYGAGVSSADELRTVLISILDGQRSFETKSENDLRQSPTAIAGDYVLERLSHV
jgi:tRNA (guanine-N7-)-methyltransferase